MFAFVRVSEGLLIAHVGLALSFLVGTILFPWCDRKQALRLPAFELMARVVATCGIGMAVVGFAAFSFAMIGWLKAPVFFPGILLVVLGVAIRHRITPFTRRFWYNRLTVIAGCWGISSYALYLLLVVLALPAIVANMGGSDPVGYHLVYAAEWAQTGRLTIDPFLRLPFYASNFLLLYAALISVGGAAFVNFLSWAMALLTALGVGAMAECALARNTSRPYAATIATALAVSVIAAPMYLRWMDTAYIDTAIGAFVLMSLMCALIAVRERSFGWLVSAAVIGGFLVGMKGSFFVLLPVYVLAIAMAARRLDLSRRRLLAVMAVLVVCASPWYMRNIVLAGDPAPPVFNVALYGSDGLMTKGEWKQDEADLSTPKTPLAIAALPFNAFLDPQSRYFREYGSTALMLLLYVPLIAVIALFAFGRDTEPGLALAAVFVGLLSAYWAFSSSLLRYASLFYPSLAVCVALAVALLPMRGRRAFQAGVAIAALALALPSPGSRFFFHDFVMSRFRYLPSSYLSDDYYLRLFSPGYKETMFVAGFMRTHHLGTMVYELGMRSQYDFQRQGITAVGDWMGVGGYFRLYRAVDARQAPAYLRSLGINSIVIAPRGAITAMNQPLKEQLLAGGFCRVSIPGSDDYQLYVSMPSACAAEAQGDG